MATNRKPGTQQRWIDEMRASARMRARLMRKIPTPMEFPHRSVDVVKADPPDHLFALAGATAAAIGIRTDANGPEEPPPRPADKPNRE
jgi:hypothetical protein